MRWPAAGAARSLQEFALPNLNARVKAKRAHNPGIKGTTRTRCQVDTSLEDTARRREAV